MFWTATEIATQTKEQHDVDGYTDVYADANILGICSLIKKYKNAF